MEAKSKFWQKVLSEGVNLYDPDAVAGWGPLSLPSDHWLTNAARSHDAWYVARELDQVPKCAKDRADAVFFNVALIDAKKPLETEQRHFAEHPGPITQREWDAWTEYAEKLDALCWAWLAIRSPIGKLAWDT